MSPKSSKCSKSFCGRAKPPPNYCDIDLRNVTLIWGGVVGFFLGGIFFKIWFICIVKNCCFRKNISFRLRGTPISKKTAVFKKKHYVSLQRNTFFKKTVKESVAFEQDISFRFSETPISKKTVSTLCVFGKKHIVSLQPNTHFKKKCVNLLLFSIKTYRFASAKHPFQKKM